MLAHSHWDIVRLGGHVKGLHAAPHVGVSKIAASSSVGCHDQASAQPTLESLVDLARTSSGLEEGTGMEEAAAGEA